MFDNLISIQGIDEYISKFLPKLFYIVEEGENTSIAIYVPDYEVKRIFLKLTGIISNAICFKVLPMSTKKEV